MQDVHIGPLPPPLGGISIYLYRLSKLDKDALYLDYYKLFRRYNIFKLWWIKDVLFNFKKKNYIFHSSSLRDRLLFYFLSCISIHEFSLVFHGRSLIEQYKRSNKLIRLLIIKMLNKANFIQVVNPEFKDFIRKLKIKNKNIFIKKAFLPPPIEEENKIINTYESELIDFLNSKKPLIIANGSYLRFYKNIDLYGLDMCIELIKMLKKDYSNIGVIFALANSNRNISYLKKMKFQIANLNIENDFYFLIGQKEIWPLFKKADLFVRPTNTDGDSASIREALYFNTPVIASDVTSRPKKCYIFKNRDLKDLYKECKKVLDTKLKKDQFF